MYFARKVFDEMSLRSTPTWNALITGYSSQKRECDDNAVKALVCFKDMLVVGDSEVKPSCTTMTCVLAAASQLGSLEIGMCVHGFVVKMVDAVENDVFVGTGLVDMYAKCGCLEIASDVFGMMKERNVLTWTALTTGMAFHGKGNNAIDMLKEMKRCNVMPNVVTFTSVLTACCHAGLVEEGLHLFHHMKNEFGVTPLIEHYGCIVDLLGKAGHLIEAYDFIVRMRIKPDPVLWRSLLSSCRLHGDLIMGDRVGKVLLQLQKDTFPGDLSTPSQDYIGLANVYALANRWDDVGTVRGEMKTKGLEIKPGRSAVH